MRSPISLFTGMIEVEITSSGMPGLMLGVQEGEDAVWALMIDEGGNFIWADITNLKTSWRYDFGRGEWVELKETDDTQDNSTDGGEGFSGSVPELDELGEGDSLDEEGRQAAGSAGYMDAGEDQ